jgi:hypothetical protein
MESSPADSDRQTQTNLLIAGGVALATIGGVLLGVGGNGNADSHDVGWVLVAVGVVLVLGALVLAARRRSAAKIIRDPTHVFDLAISTLESGNPWEMVRIYAPVGLWDKADSNVPDAKTRWLMRLAEALCRQGDTKKPEVEGLKAVFGLPQEHALYDDYAKPKLEIFQHTQHTELRYFPPEEESHPMAAPGMGIIIFETRSENRYKLVFAFVGRTPGEEAIVVRSGFSLKDKEVGRLVADWFDGQVWKRAEYFGLRGPYRDRMTNKETTIELGSALLDVERRYCS